MKPLLPLLLFTSYAFAIDENRDGLSDVWARLYGIPEGSAAEDPDSDGVSNRNENAFGTNPRLNSSVSLVDCNGLPQWTVYEGLNALQWRGQPGIRYQAKRSSDLLSWSNAGPVFTGNGGLITLTFTVPADRRFAMLESLPPFDVDNDGLNAHEESLLGTSDGRDDSDDDNVPDLVEFRLHLHPNSSMSLDGDAMPDDWEVYRTGDTDLLESEDLDQDGFSNRDEFEFALDPTSDEWQSGASSHIYSYDATNRLTAVDSALPESFVLDPEGNPTTSR